MTSTNKPLILQYLTGLAEELQKMAAEPQPPTESLNPDRARVQILTESNVCLREKVKELETQLANVISSPNELMTRINELERELWAANRDMHVYKAGAVKDLDTLREQLTTVGSAHDQLAADNLNLGNALRLASRDRQLLINKIDDLYGVSKTMPQN
jgi:chromosome segregation ATPase